MFLLLYLFVVLDSPLIRLPIFNYTNYTIAPPFSVVERDANSVIGRTTVIFFCNTTIPIIMGIRSPSAHITSCRVGEGDKSRIRHFLCFQNVRRRSFVLLCGTVCVFHSRCNNSKMPVMCATGRRRRSDGSGKLMAGGIRTYKFDLRISPSEFTDPGHASPIACIGR